MVPEAGQRFGPYEILGKLGGGGMGIVFRAWDERLHREVAIKLLHDDYETPGMRERFLLEARAASALNHPNICTIFDIGEQEGEPYLVMEVLEGMTLKQKIAQGAVPVEDLVRISEEVSEALAAAHAKGIVHRDIKPANIFLVRKPGGKPQAKVLDFGLAKINQASRAGRASQSIEITSAGSTVGTLAYMSPEQARGEPLDARSDLFSLGVVMYEMATRRVPFRGSTTALVYVELLSQAPQSMRQWNDTIPKDLERLIFRLLAKDRSERPQSAKELYAALRKLSIKDEGNWLKKVPRASVPLVQAPDPVARENRGRRKESSSAFPAADFSVVARVNEEAELDAGGDVIRPRRLATRESGPRESAFRSDRGIDGTADGGSDPGTGSAAPGRGVHAGPEVVGEVALAAPSPARESSGKEAVSGPIPRAAPADAAPVPVPGGPVAGPRSRAVRVPEPETTVQVEPEEVTVLPPEPSTPVVDSLSAGAAETLEEETLSEVGEKPELVRSSRSSYGLIAAIGLLAAGVLGLSLWVRGGGFGRVVLGPGDSVLLTEIQNKTGDPTFDGAVMQGLEIQLAQSALRWRGQEAFRAGIRQVVSADHVNAGNVSGRAAALRLGARAYVYGEVTGNGAPYTINVEVLEAKSNDRLASLSETAAGKRDVAHAIDRLAIDLRQRLGEDAGTIRERQTALESQGTANLEALSALAQAEEARESAHLIPAVELYAKALRAAPEFSLAGVELAWTYESQYAELEAADAARKAKQSAGHSGDRVRMMAEVAGAALDTQDYAAAGGAARRLINLYPKDETSLLTLARVMRLQGHMTESLLSAEEAYRREPTSGEAYREAGRALLGLNRFEEALRLADTAKEAGVADDSWREAAAYLSGRGAPEGPSRRRQPGEPCDCGDGGPGDCVGQFGRPAGRRRGLAFGGKGVGGCTGPPICGRGDVGAKAL